MADENNEYYTVTRAAQILAVSRTTILRWIEIGKLPAYRFGPKTFRIKKKDVEGVVTLYEGSSKQTTIGTVRESWNAQEPDIWAGYDPQRVREALRKSFGALRRVDREQLLRDIHDERAQASHGRPA